MDAEVETPNRADLPVRRHYSSASFDAALQAALPANRKRTLDDLDANLLARSSTRPMETRVKAWQRLCEASDLALSLLMPSRRYAHHYVRGGTPRSKGTSTPPSGIRRRNSASRWSQSSGRLAKAATRGLIAGRLKESFDVDALANVVGTNHYMDVFDIKNASHVVDILIACWFMMRASAKTSDVEF